MQHMFLRVVSIPAFSRANDISRDDVLEMVFTLRIDEALAQLRRAFPVHFPQIGDFAVTEPSDYPDDAATGYEPIHRDFIDPIEQAYALVAADHHRHRQRIRRARLSGAINPCPCASPGVKRRAIDAGAWQCCGG